MSLASEPALLRARPVCVPTVVAPPKPSTDFRRVYEQHFRFVWRSLRALGVREHDVTDAVQDVFLAVHRGLGGFEGRSSVQTWLFGICMRVASNRRRLAHVRRETQNLDELPEPVDEQSDVGREVEKRLGLSLLEEILDQLPDEQRAVFVLFEIEAASGDEIASLLGIPLGTVYSRLRLAREAFQRALSRRRARDRESSIREGRS